MVTVDLKSFRKTNYLNQTDVAKYLGISKSFISRVEKGREKLPEKQLERLMNNDMGWDITPLLSEIEIDPEPDDEDLFAAQQAQELNKDVLIENMSKTIAGQQETIERLSRIIERLTLSEKGEATVRTA